MAQVKQIMQRDEYDGRVLEKQGWATAADGLHTGWSVGVARTRSERTALLRHAFANNDAGRRFS